MLGSGLKPDRIGLRKVLGACMVVDVDVMSEAHVKAGHGPLPPLLSFISHPVGRAIIVTARCLQYSCQRRWNGPFDRGKHHRCFAFVRGREVLSEDCSEEC